MQSQSIEDFHRDGACVLRGVLSREEIETLTRGIEKNLATPGPLAAVASGADDPGRFFEDFCNWQRIAEYEAIMKHSALPAIARALMRSDTARIHHDHLLVKEAGTKQPTPWHQDQPYYNIDGRQNVSFWIPVDPVDRATTLEFLAGSHDGAWYMPRTFHTNQAKWFPEGTLADLPDMTLAENKARGSVGRWSPAIASRFTCSRYTPHPAPRNGVVYSARDIWVMTSCTRRALGGHRRSLPGCAMSWLLACRWRMRCFRSWITTLKAARNFPEANTRNTSVCSTGGRTTFPRTPLTSILSASRAVDFSGENAAQLRSRLDTMCPPNAFACKWTVGRGLPTLPGSTFEANGCRSATRG
jgi:Phytanoyl-CoA dioxygenase (PhyH)